MITLRDYQLEAIKNIRRAFSKREKHIILQSATGSGKTIIFTYMAKNAIDKNKKVLILTNRTELLLQAGGALKKIGMNSFYIQAGCQMINNNFNCFIAMSQTLRNRINKLYWKDFMKSIDLVIIDETHLQDFNYLFESGLLQKKYVVGASATPQRAGKMKQLGLDYNKIITTIPIRDLINKGYLVNADYYASDSPDLSKIPYNAMKGDYQESQMFKIYNTPKLYAGVIKNYNKYVPGTKSLCFCVNIEHTIKTTIQLNEAGISAKFLVSNVSVPKLKDIENKGSMARYEERLKVYDLYKKYYEIYSGERETIINEFKDNKFTILVNASILTTGFDCPDVETIILNRATISLTLYLQMIGRGSRPTESKTFFNILDFGDNIRRFGKYEEVREWGLWHEESKGGGLAPHKNCGYESNGKPIINNDRKGCNRMILASYTICPFCGFKYPEKTLKEIDLSIITPTLNGNVLAPRNKSFRHMSLEELHAYYKAKGHKPPWLWRQLWYRGKETELTKYANIKNWKNKTLKQAVHYCKSVIN